MKVIDIHSHILPASLRDAYEIMSCGMVRKLNEIKKEELY